MPPGQFRILGRPPKVGGYGFCKIRPGEGSAPGTIRGSHRRYPSNGEPSLLNFLLICRRQWCLKDEAKRDKELSCVSCCNLIISCNTFLGSRGRPSRAEG